MGFDIRENVSPFFFIIKYVFNMANINKIRISGTSYDIQDSNATKVVDITQAEYDALPASAKTANILYNITDAEAVDLSQYWTSAETQSAITEATSGKVSTSDFNTYSGSVDTALNSKASQTDLNALSGTVTGHTANTSIHVSPEQIAAWNAKSDFSGSYNDLTDKPTIPTVPTSNTAFTNDAGYLVANDITGKTDTSAFTAHTASTVHMTTTEKTNLDSLATNIAAISGITSSKVGNWDTASTNSHTHSNKTVLDGINSTKVSNWDGAVTNASNAVTALGGLKLVKLTQAQYDALATKDNSTLYVIVG